MLLRPAVSPSPDGSIYCLRPAPLSALRLTLPATCGSIAGPAGPPPDRAHMPEVAHAESNRNSLSGPRHTPLDTRPANDLVSPPTPGALIAPAGTHTNNPGSLPRISAPGSTGSPFALPGRVPSVFPTASASHSPLECKRVALPAAYRSSYAATPVSLPEIPLRLGLTPQSARL